MFPGRMLDKSKMPEGEDISSHIGPISEKNLLKLEHWLESRYDLRKELRFPFGNQYGWACKYSHGSKHLFYLFFEKDSITATLQIGNGSDVEKMLPDLSPYAQQLWAMRYPCGKNSGGWIHYRIVCENQVDEAALLIGAKYPLIKKK